MKILLIVGLILAAHLCHAFSFETGDLVFQDLDCGGLCDAIEEVTSGHDKHRFSHIAIVDSAEAGKETVIEAFGKVVRTPLASLLKRSVDEKGQSKIAVGRLKEKYQLSVQEAIQYATNQLGKPYDEIFEIGENSFYCSELVFFAFLGTGGKPLFDLGKMTFKVPGSNEFYPAWTNYYRNLKAKIPEGRLGINPGGISRSPYLNMYYPYGEVSKKP